LTEEAFSLNGDPRNNYINLILNDMKIFNAWYSSQKNTFETARALRALLLDLPPPGQEYMKDELYDLVQNWEHSKFWQSYKEMGTAYQKAIAWIWPNMLQEYFSAKPRNPQPTTLGE
jgi:hypothetical protein